MRIIVPLLSIALFFPPMASAGASFANMSSLLARGVDFDGKEIVVSGYRCKVSDSIDGLFLTADDCKQSNYDNAIRLEFPGGSLAQRRGLVQVRGVFRYTGNVIKTDDPYRWGELLVEAVY